MNNEPGRIYNPITGELPHNGVETSVEAAETMLSPASAIREQVFAYVKERGWTGAICDEAEVSLNISHQTCSARFRELQLAGRIRKTEGKRKTRSGRNAFIYLSAALTEQGDMFGGRAA